MSDLLLTNIPDDLCERLMRSAAGHECSVAEEALRLLRLAVEGEDARARHAILLAEIQRQRTPLPAGATDSVELLREDRSR